MPIGTKFGYVQFLGSHREHGETILVNPVLHARQASFNAGFFANGYVAFYPAGLAVTQRRAQVVAQSPPPQIPKRRRRPAVVAEDGTVKSWVIEGGWRNVVKETLTEDELRMPIAKIWDHEFLSAQIAKGWTPSPSST